MFSFAHSQKRKLIALLAVVLAVVVPVTTVHAGFSGALTIGLPILEFFARIAGLAGIALNYAVVELVFSMGDKVNNNFGASLESAWGIIRDIMNMMFIFGLIWIGFQIILDASSNKAKRLLPPLIIAALLMNFSLNITKAVVEVSNLLAVEIYGAMSFVSVDENGGSGTTMSDVAGDGTTDETSDAVNIGISGAYMQIMGLKDVLSPTKFEGNTTIDWEKELETACSANTEKDFNCTSNILVFIFTASIFLMIAAYTFAVGAFMLVARFVILVMLMIFSPVMFAGMIFPKAGRMMSRWWGTLLGNAFFAPAYFLMLYIGVVIAGKLGVVDEGDGFFGAAAGKYMASDVIFHFIVTAAFLILAVMAAKEMGAAGAKASISVGNRLAQGGSKLFASGTAGLTARGMRSTVGYGAKRYADSDISKDSKFGRSLVGRQVWKGATSVADTSFDARKLLSKNTQKWTGAGKKGGYTSRLKEDEKAEKKYVEDIGTRDMSKNSDGSFKNAYVQKEYERRKAELAPQEKALAEAEAAVASAASEEEKKEKQQKVKDARGALKKAEISLLSKIEYGRQLNRIDQLERSAKFWKNPLLGRATGAGAGYVGSSVINSTAGSVSQLAGFIAPSFITVAGTGAGIGAGYVAAGSASYGATNSANALKKAYGADGTKAKKAKQRKDEAKLISDIIKDESGDSGKEDKEDES